MTNPVFNDDIEYQPLRDFVYTSLISLVSSALIVHPSLPVRSVKDLIALARPRPGELLMGSAGQGSGTHCSTSTAPSKGATTVWQAGAAAWREVMALEPPDATKW